MRLDKCLTNCGGTRSSQILLKSQTNYRQPEIVSNGKKFVNPETDEILFDVRKLQPQRISSMFISRIT